MKDLTFAEFGLLRPMTASYIEHTNLFSQEGPVMMSELWTRLNDQSILYLATRGEGVFTARPARLFVCDVATRAIKDSPHRAILEQTIEIGRLFALNQRPKAVMAVQMKTLQKYEETITFSSLKETAPFLLAGDCLSTLPSVEFMNMAQRHSYLPFSFPSTIDDETAMTLWAEELKAQANFLRAQPCFFK